MDGTALNSKKQLSQRTMAAIANAIKSGKIIVPATARSLDSIPAELMELNGLSHLILNNGAAVVSMPEKDILYSHVFEKQISLSLFEQFKTFPCIILAAKPETSMMDRSIHRIKDEKLKLRFQEIIRSWNPLVTDIGEGIRENPPWVNFFTLVFTDGEEWQRVFHSLKKQEGLNIASSTWGCIDIMPEGIHKGMALRFIAEKLGFNMKEVMAIGDNLNDMEMLQNSGIGVAMGNSVEALKEQADRITLSCDEDGAAIAIEEIIQGI